MRHETRQMPTEINYCTVILPETRPVLADWAGILHNGLTRHNCGQEKRKLLILFQSYWYVVVMPKLPNWGWAAECFGTDTLFRRLIALSATSLMYALPSTKGGKTSAAISNIVSRMPAVDRGFADIRCISVGIVSKKRKRWFETISKRKLNSEIDKRPSLVSDILSEIKEEMWGRKCRRQVDGDMIDP